MSEIKNYLGIDWGEKRVGLATGDSEVKLALPLITVSSLAEVLKIVAEERSDIIVIGDPVKMSGAKSDNPKWLAFLSQLREKSGKPVELIDERLSSLAADALGGAESERAGRDEIAAAILLQQYLDKL